MAASPGKSPLAVLKDFVARNWYTKGFVALAADTADRYHKRNEVLSGGIVTDGTATATEMMCTTTALECVLVGRRMVTLAAITDDDLLDTATTGVGQPIFQDGATATGLALTNGDTARVTIIVCNSDEGVPGAADEDDNGTPILVAVVAGTSATFAAQTAHLTTTEIQAALDASDTMHDGVTGWAHVAQCLYADTGGVSWLVTPTMNRNNVVSEA
jgi:hypothetical protein